MFIVIYIYIYIYIYIFTFKTLIFHCFHNVLNSHITHINSTVDSLKYNLDSLFKVVLKNYSKNNIIYSVISMIIITK